MSEFVEQIETARNEYGNDFDVNSGKDLYVQASYKIGGLGVLGSGSEGVLKQNSNWRDNSLTVGAYYYRGTAGAFLDTHVDEEEHSEGEKEPGHEEEALHLASLTPPGVFAGGHDDEEPAPSELPFYTSGNNFYRAGVKFDAWLWDLNLFGNWQRNHDRLDFGLGAYNADIAMVELGYVTPWPWVQPAIRFEQVQPDWGSSFNRWSPSLTLLVRANTMLTIEGARSGKSAPNLPPFDDYVRVGFRVYF